MERSLPCSGAQEWSKPSVVASATAELTSGGTFVTSAYAELPPMAITEYLLMGSDGASEIW